MPELMYIVYAPDSIVVYICVCVCVGFSCVLFSVWQTDMFRGLLWLFNSLHKEWGRAGGKGVMQFSIFVQFPALETVWGHSEARCYVGVFAFSPHKTPSPPGSRLFCRSPCDLCERADIAAARWGITPFFFAILPGDYLTSVWVSSLQLPNTYQTAHYSVDVDERDVTNLFFF